MAQKKLIVHIILNSHLDPVWLWKQEQGIDEVISTARTACDLLDLYPEIHLTRGEAWFYETVERHDPATFARLRNHIAGGRLHVVGNWYVQPDCNLASPESYRMHGEIASAYFREKFGLEQVETGYNVDSFGHGAFLPDFYRACGVRNYCMMRPSPQEKSLPGEIFRWRSPNGAELLTARIFESYSSSPEYLPGHLDRVIAAADRRVGHALCFCGVGDHGGGPARAEIDYLLAHRCDREDVEIRFSHPDAFFDGVRRSGVELPVVTGELQHHAIGCYSACSMIKRSVRLTEDRLIQAEKFLSRTERERAWKLLLFATFHDLLPGSSIASAYDGILDSLGAARTLAREAVIRAVRRRNRRFQPDPLQRLVFDNTGPEEYCGIFEVEPWVSWEYSKGRRAIESIRLLDERGRALPVQPLPPEAAVKRLARLAFPLKLAAGERRILHLDYQGPVPAGALPEHAGGRISDGTLVVEGFDTLRCNGRDYFGAPLRIDVSRDPSDTWSHGMNGYAVKAERSFRPSKPFRRHFTGPLISESIGEFRDGQGNRIAAALRFESGLRGIRLRLRLDWHGAQQLVKLVLTPGFRVVRRIDGAPGGEVARALNGEEFPLFNFCRLEGKTQSLAVVSKECFAADVQPDGTLRLTLLRTPYYANHDPYRVKGVNAFRITDQGEHDYEFSLLVDPSAEEIRREICRRKEPVVFSESTLGVRRDLV